MIICCSTPATLIKTNVTTSNVNDAEVLFSVGRWSQIYQRLSLLANEAILLLVSRGDEIPPVAKLYGQKQLLQVILPTNQRKLEPLFPVAFINSQIVKTFRITSLRVIYVIVNNHGPMVMPFCNESNNFSTTVLM